MVGNRSKQLNCISPILFLLWTMCHGILDDKTKDSIVIRWGAYSIEFTIYTFNEMQFLWIALKFRSSLFNFIFTLFTFILFSLSLDAVKGRFAIVSMPTSSIWFAFRSSLNVFFSASFMSTFVVVSACVYACISLWSTHKACFFPCARVVTSLPVKLQQNCITEHFPNVLNYLQSAHNHGICWCCSSCKALTILKLESYLQRNQIGIFWIVSLGCKEFWA